MAIQESQQTAGDKPKDGAQSEAAQAERLGDTLIDDEAKAVVDAAELEVREALNRFQYTPGDVDAEALPERQPTADGAADASEKRERAPAFRYGEVKPPPTFTKPLPPKDGATKLRYVEGAVPVSDSARETLSQDTLRNEPDVYSAYNIAPQPDGGRGMQAVASMFHEREQARIASRVPSGDAEGATPPPKTVAWFHTHHGLDVRDFKAKLDEADRAHGGTSGSSRVVSNTRAVIACDSQEKIDAIQGANMFGDWEVTYELINPQQPETIEIPKGTAVALFPETLDKLPARQILVHPVDHGVRQVVEATAVADTDPLVHVDPKTGYAHTLQPAMLASNKTLEGAVRDDLKPQLSGRLISDRFVPTDDQQLGGREEAAVAFLVRQPRALIKDGGTPLNWQESVYPILQRVTKGLDKDGMIYVSGLLRDGFMGNEALLDTDQMDTTQGPITSHVVEFGEIFRAVQSVDKAAKFQALGDRRGGYAQLVIDRSEASPDEFEETLTHAFALDEEVLRKAGELNDQRQSLALARTPQLKANLATEVRQRWDEVVALDPQLGRDYAFVHELAKDLNASGDFEDAREIARAAIDAAPHFSGGWVEVARAELGLGNAAKTADERRSAIASAAEALDRATEINPNNPAIFEVTAQQRDAQEGLKDRLLEMHAAGRLSDASLRERAARLGDAHTYVRTVSDYLNSAPNLSSNEVVEWLRKISEAQERNFRIHGENTDTFKTFYVQDLQTGKLEERTMSASDATRIIAAETALQNAEAIAALLRQEGASPRQINAAMEPFLEIWERTVPRDSDDLPLPRDEWDDLPQEQTERWIFAGSMRESDQMTEPSATWHERVAHQQDAPAEASDSSSVAPANRAYKVPVRSSVEMGHIIERDGTVSDEVKTIDLKLFNRHVYVSGASGTGKSEFVKNSIGYFARNTKVKTIVIYMGDNEGEYDELAARYGDGVRVQHWRPGEVDAEAVSVNLFNPGPGVSLEDHVNQLVAWWQRVYEGNDPFPQVLGNALLKVYEINGWNTITGERGELPTFEQLQTQCEVEVKEAKYQGEAKNIEGYFRTRNQKNGKGMIGRFLETELGSVEIDWEKAIDRTDSDVLVVDLRSGFANPEDRRNMGMAFEIKLRQAFQARGIVRGENMNLAVIMDEAQQAVRNPEQGEATRRRAVQAFAQGFEQDRKNGVCRIIATPTEDIEASIEANTAVQIRFAEQSAQDIERASGSVLVGRDEYALALSTQEVGQALITERGKGKATHVQVPLDPVVARLTPEIIREAVAKQPALSTIRSGIYAPKKPYTHLEIEKARQQVDSGESAWKVQAVGAVALAHIMGHDLPSQFPEQARRQWQAEVEKDSRMAHFVLDRIVSKVVKERLLALRQNERPIRTNLLAASIMAHTVDLLNGESSGGRVSPAFSFLPARVGMAYRELADPLAGRAANESQYAVPLGFRIPQPVIPAQLGTYRARQGGDAEPNGREHVGAQIRQLQTYQASPVSGHGSTKDRAALHSGQVWTAIFGKDSGKHLWRSQRAATHGSIRETEPQRALIATELGYLASPYYPERSPFEATLHLPGYLREHVAQLKKQHKQEYQKV